MSRSLKNRSKTIEAIMAGSRVATAGPVKQRLDDEWRALAESARLARPRRELLQVIHTSRLLDSFMASFLAHHAILYSPPPGMGNYLKALRDHSRPAVGKLPEHRRLHHQNHVVRVRNVFMHQAGVFPTQKQADELLSSMHVCLAEVAALE